MLLAALRLLGSESSPGTVVMLIGCLGLISCRVWFLSAPRAQEDGVLFPVSKLALDEQDFALLQVACIEHANQLIADADTEDDDFGPDGDLALQFRADAARLLAMHHEFTERGTAPELTAPCHGDR